MIQNIAVIAGELTLDPWPLAASDVIAGDPQISGRVILAEADRQIGVWQITPGTIRDVEAEELFIVLAGSATVEVEGGQVLELRPGVLGLLREGARTVWRVHDTLRKVYCLKPRASGSVPAP